MVRDSHLSDDGMRAGFFYSLDPRTKLVVLSVLLVAVFSAMQVWRLCILTSVAFAGVFLVRGSRFRIMRRLYAMRWIFFTGLLLHLFSGSGRTIMGISFLSFDGLIEGGLVVWRLALAVLFASLFCFSTPVPVLAKALMGMMRPFRKIMPVNRIGLHVLLVLTWVPIVHDAIFVARQQRKQTAECSRRGLNGVITDLYHIIDQLLVTAENLVETVMVGDYCLLNLPSTDTEKHRMSEVGMLLMSLVFMSIWFWGLP
jgi:energy-coupling factor transport system permease protein